MGWTTPRTWTTGENPTAATLNTHLRDNLSFLYTVPAATMYIGSGNFTHNSTGNFIQTTGFAEGNDTDTIYTTSTDYLQIVTAGRYFILAVARFNSNATGYRGLNVQSAPSPYSTWTDRTTSYADAINGQDTTLVSTVETALSAGDRLIHRVYQNSGGNLTVQGNSAGYMTYLTVRFMGP